MGGRVAGRREEEGRRGGEEPDALRGRRARPSPSRLTCAASASAHSPSRFAGPPGTCAATLPSRGCRAEQAGGRITQQASSPSWGGLRGYFADPDGFAWEITWNPAMELDVDGRVFFKD